MYDKCHKCIFADEEHDMGATFPVCIREEDFIEAVNAREDKEQCPWHITYKKIIELQGKSCNVIQDMLHEQKGINWNDYPTAQKRGVCWTREKGVDYDMPMLKGEDRKYLEDLVHFVEEE